MSHYVATSKPGTARSVGGCREIFLFGGASSAMVTGLKPGASKRPAEDPGRASTRGVPDWCSRGKPPCGTVSAHTQEIHRVAHFCRKVR